MSTNFDAMLLCEAHGFDHQRRVASVETACDIGNIDISDELMVRALFTDMNSANMRIHFILEHGQLTIFHFPKPSPMSQLISYLCTRLDDMLNSNVFLDATDVYVYVKNVSQSIWRKKKLGIDEMEYLTRCRSHCSLCNIIKPRFVAATVKRAAKQTSNVVGGRDAHGQLSSIAGPALVHSDL